LEARKLTEIITITDIIITDQPRISSVKLGEALGYATNNEINRLIQRNMEELASYAFVRHGDAKTTTDERGRGRTSVEYLLNKSQALLIGMLSRTEPAKQVRMAMIKAFLEIEKREEERRAADVARMQAVVELHDDFIARYNELVTRQEEFENITNARIARLESRPLKSSKIPMLTAHEQSAFTVQMHDDIKLLHYLSPEDLRNHIMYRWPGLDVPDVTTLAALQAKYKAEGH
jgi:phage regulator Rha-like protein